MDRQAFCLLRTLDKKIFTLSNSRGGSCRCYIQLQAISGQRYTLRTCTGPDLRLPSFSADYFPVTLSVATWLAIYDIAMPVVNIEDLKLTEDHEYNPSYTRNARGRPKKKQQDQAIYRTTRGLRNTKLKLEDQIITTRPRNRCGKDHNTQTYKQPYQ
jgi:hypothetical protein